MRWLECEYWIDPPSIKIKGRHASRHSPDTMVVEWAFLAVQTAESAAVFKWRLKSYLLTKQFKKRERNNCIVFVAVPACCPNYSLTD